VLIDSPPDDPFAARSKTEVKVQAADSAPVVHSGQCETAKQAADSLWAAIASVRDVDKLAIRERVQSWINGDADKQAAVTRAFYAKTEKGGAVRNAR
jgi:hypothetical protein